MSLRTKLVGGLSKVSVSNVIVAGKVVCVACVTEPVSICQMKADMSGMQLSSVYSTRGAELCTQM